MKVTIIDNIDKFHKLRKTWNDIYAMDPDATAFESWAWLCGWLESTPQDWLVLAIRQNDALPCAHANQARCASTYIVSESEPYVAFMALSVSKEESGCILSMGGYPFADHTGFVCLPEYVEVAIPAFAAFIREQLQWDRLRLANVFDPRLDLFVKHLSSQWLSIQESKGPLCPYIPLPDNWDQYFNKFLGHSTRKNLRNDLNRIRRLEGFHVTEIQNGNAESHIDTLLKLWQSRWELKSDDLYMDLRLEDVLNIKRSFLRHCFEDNRLWLNILWDGETPIAAGAVLLDGSKKHFCVIKTAVNYQYAQYSPGNILRLYAIQYAIEQGYKICDFGRGDERHKFVLGSEERFNRHVVIIRMNPIMKLIVSLRSQLQIRTRIKRLTGDFVSSCRSLR
jgi:hypothetical protein